MKINDLVQNELAAKNAEIAKLREELDACGTIIAGMMPYAPMGWTQTPQSEITNTTIAVVTTSNGYEYVGPFDSHQSAFNYIRDHLRSCCLAPLRKPVKVESAEEENLK